MPVTRTIRPSTLLVVPVAVAAALVGACSGSDQEERPSAVVTSGAGTGDLFVHGVVEREGHPVDGAEVEVVLTPEDLSDVEVGEAVRQLVASSARSDADGSFAVRLDPDEVPSKYFGLDREFLNFELRVADSQDFATWHTTLHPVGDPTVWRTWESAAPADAAMRIALDLEAERIVITDSVGEEQRSDLPVLQLGEGSG